MMENENSNGNLKRKENKIISSALIIGIAAFIIAIFCSYKYTVASAIILMTAAALIYTMLSILEKSFFDVKAIFSVVWIGTIGLSCLRLNPNQKPWLPETWVCFTLTYVCFMAGCWISNAARTRNNVKHMENEFSIGKLRFSKRKISEKGFFTGIIIFFAVIFFSFLLQVYKLGFIPLFSSDMSAYMKFHISGISYFVVSCILIFPYSYYYIKNYLPSKYKKIVIIIINIIAFLIPMLIVSRQLYILNIMLAMFIMINVGKKKELLSIFVAAAVLIGGWGILSYFRHQNEAYLDSVFNKEIVKTTDDTTVNNGSIKINFDSIIIPKNKIYSSDNFNNSGASKASIKLPMPLYQVYMYTAFNYDNFNYNVYMIDRYSVGCKTLFPVFALTGLKFVIPAFTNFPVYNYNANFTTNPGIYYSYYDFGIAGVVLFMVLIGFLANSLTNKYGSRTITKLIYDSLMKYCLLFFFFTSFFSNATMWFYFIMVGLIHIIINYSICLKNQ